MAKRRESDTEIITCRLQKSRFSGDRSSIPLIIFGATRAFPPMSRGSDAKGGGPRGTADAVLGCTRLRPWCSLNARAGFGGEGGSVASPHFVPHCGFGKTIPSMAPERLVECFPPDPLMPGLAAVLRVARGTSPWWQLHMCATE